MGNNELIYSEPGKAICDYAEKNGVDTVCLGSRNLGLMKRVFLGSVGNLIHLIPCKEIIAHTI